MNTYNCPICGKVGQTSLLERGERYMLYRCSHCQGDFAITASSMDYRQDYQTGDLSAKRLAEPESELRESKLFAHFSQALKILETFTPNHRLLNICRGSAVFSKLAEDLGFEVHTLEFIPEAIQYAQEGFMLKNTIAGSIDDIPAEWHDFDFVTCFEFLEHVEEPLKLSKKVYELLVPGGYFIVSAPNRNRLSVKLAHRDAHDYPPYHLTRWTKEILFSFLTDIGFDNVVVKIDGVNRRDIGSILLPNTFVQQITRRKIKGLSQKDPERREFFLYNPLWRFTLIIVDFFANMVRIITGKRYGSFLIGFAQKPLSNVNRKNR